MTVRQPYLDPGEENHDGQCRVEDHFPVAETLEVTVLIWVRQQLLEDIVDFHRAVDVEDDTADSHEDDNDVQNVPERLQIRQLQILDLFSQAYNESCISVSCSRSQGSVLQQYSRLYAVRSAFFATATLLVLYHCFRYIGSY